MSTVISIRGSPRRFLTPIDMFGIVWQEASTSIAAIIITVSLQSREQTGQAMLSTMLTVHRIHSFTTLLGSARRRHMLSSVMEPHSWATSPSACRLYLYKGLLPKAVQKEGTQSDIRLIVRVEAKHFLHERNIPNGVVLHTGFKS